MSPAFADTAFAHTWLIDGQKVDGDFVREGRGEIKAKNGKMVPVALVILSVRGKEHNYQFSKLSPDDKKYEQEQVKEQKRIAKDVEERSWKDNKGHSMLGRFIGIEGNKVVLLTQRNDTIGYSRWPFKDFCRDDRNYVRKEMTNRGEGDKVPADPPPKQDGPKVAQGTKPKEPKKTKPNPQPNTAPPNSAPAAVASTSKPSEPAHPETLPPASQHPAPAQQATTQPVTTQPAPAVPSPAVPVPVHPAPATSSPAHQAKAKPPASPPAQSLVAKTTAEPKRAVAAAETAPPLPPVKSRVCSNCGHKLPNTVKAGDSCPNCGAYLQYEKTDQGPPIQVSSTFRTLGAPVGLASLLCVIAVAVFRVRSYAQH
jgi:hypothetical protein